MTHMKPVAEHDGDLGEWKLDDVACRKCKQKGQVFYRPWSSSCGGYEDYKYECRDCGHSWWIEGIDS